MMSLTKEEVVSALRTCHDPEIPVNVVDLGLIYDVAIQGAADGGCDVSVKMTLTSPSCPMSQAIAGDVHRRLLDLESVRHATVDLVWEPVWNSSMITAEGRRQLNPN